MTDEQVMLGHGSGGSMMKRIIDEVFMEAYGNDTLNTGDDAAVLDIPSAPAATTATADTATTAAIPTTPTTATIAAATTAIPSSAPNAAQPSAQFLGQNVSHETFESVLKSCDACDFNTSTDVSVSELELRVSEGIFGDQTQPRLAFSTDSFVVTPHFFPGGDIGRLAVCGTVNDVATSGARPFALSCGMILEEGFRMDDLRRICRSMAQAAEEAGVRIVTGDTKVVNRGHGDGVFINTSGVGVLAPGVELGGAYCRPGDVVLVSGTLGDHGITIMSQREGLFFSADVESDAAPLNHLIADVMKVAPDVRCFRDPTRGGLASTLNELAAQCGADIVVDETAIPVRPAVQGACEMLGYDVLQVANEGKMVCVVAPDQADAALAAMKANRYGVDAAIIGSVNAIPNDRAPRVMLRTAFGSTRILDMLVGEQLPRIC